MDLNIVFLLLLAALASGSLSYFQYFYKKDFNRSLILPAVLRFLSLFFLLLLLINPKYHTRIYRTVKPSLKIALDGSRSMGFSGSDVEARELVEEFRTHTELNQSFDVEYYRFGSGIRILDTLDFSETQTNIEQALSQLNALSSSSTSPVVLISDGIQTLGKNYVYSKIDQRVYPIAMGDTTRISNLEITLVNVNAFASLQSTFEAEVFARYSGPGEVQTEMSVESDGEVVAKLPVSFSEVESSKQVRFEIEARELGTQLYRARIRPLPGEKQTLDNQRLFEVDVRDDKTEIAVIYSFPHPDLGMLKQSLEMQEKKKVNLISIADWNRDMSSYPVYAIYQPDSRFAELFSFLSEAGKNYFLFTGSATDWNFVGQAAGAFQMESSGLTEEVFPVFEESFNAFYIEDIGFSEFPSLNFNLGRIQFSKDRNDILKQSINGIQTEQPLLTTFLEGEARRVVLFGENLWKWRLHAFQRDGDFQKFDQFLGSLVQFLYVSDERQQLELFYEKRNFDDQEVQIRARKYDSNLNLDLRSAIELRLKGSDRVYPMYVNKGFYEVRLGNLAPGTYGFSIGEADSGLVRNGNFEVLPFSAEQVRGSADVTGLSYLAKNSGGRMYFPSQIGDLIRTLLEDPEFTTIEKEERKRVSLIDQKWLFALIVLSLSIEWFIRKYRGLV